MCKEQEDVEVMVTHWQKRVGAVCMMQVTYDVMEIKVFGYDDFCVVMSLPPERVIRSSVTHCSSEWYRLGIELGFNDNNIQAMTHTIPSSEGKLQVVIEKKSMEHGKGKVVEALLDLCEQILPLATIAIMEDLGIKYTGTVKHSSFLVTCIHYSLISL